MSGLGISRRVFGIAPREIRVERRGFQVDAPEMRSRLEEIGRSFVHGYHAALGEDDPGRLGLFLSESVSTELQGFAFEGAAMGLTLLDILAPWKRDRLDRFLTGPGARHTYMAHVGAGWALARTPRLSAGILHRLDPVLRWLALDGYGFHQGYFHWSSYAAGQGFPSLLKGYARRAFDQGLGRSFWFIDGGDPARIAARIGVFAEPRRADLWSGAGLAAAYAGGVTRGALDTLANEAGRFLPHLAQGAAFAVKARDQAGNPTPHTDLACEVICRVSPTEAGRLCDSALSETLAADLPRGGGLAGGASPPVGESLPAYERWRERLREQLTGVACA